MADGILYYTGDGDSVGSCTLWVQEEINGGVLCWRYVCQGTSLVPRFTRLCQDNGGGIICIKTLSVTLAIVRSAP